MSHQIQFWGWNESSMWSKTSAPILTLTSSLALPPDSMQRLGGQNTQSLGSTTKLNALSGHTRLVLTRPTVRTNAGQRMSTVCMSASPPLPDKPIVKEQLMTEKERSRKYRRTVSPQPSYPITIPILPFSLVSRLGCGFGAVYVGSVMTRWWDDEGLGLGPMRSGFWRRDDLVQTYLVSWPLFSFC